MKTFLLVLLVIQIVCGNVIIPLTKIKKDISHRFERVNTNSSNTVIQLRGGLPNYGEYHAVVSVGTPSQFFYVQVDTGSTDLLIFSTKCTTCPDSPYYSEDKSSTDKPVACNAAKYQCQQCTSLNGANTCAFDDQYGDGSSVSGVVLTESFQVGSLSPVTVSFGSVLSGSSNFENPPVSGIWGLAWASTSTWGYGGAFSTLVSQLNINNMFSMCLTTTGNAIMSMGIDFSNLPSIQWTPLLAQQYYPVTMTDLKSNGNSLGVSTFGQVIVDSGTTLVALGSSAFTAFQNRLLAMCTNTNLAGICGTASGQTLFDGYCFGMTTYQINQFPTLSFVIDQVGGVDVEPSQYLISQTQNGNTYYCMGISGMQDDSITILGDVFMEGVHVVFDRQNMRVGFAPLSTCPSPDANLPSAPTTAGATVAEKSAAAHHIFSCVLAIIAIVLLF